MAVLALGLPKCRYESGPFSEQGEESNPFFFIKMALPRKLLPLDHKRIQELCERLLNVYRHVFDLVLGAGQFQGIEIPLHRFFISFFDRIGVHVDMLAGLHIQIAFGGIVKIKMVFGLGIHNMEQYHIVFVVFQMP